MSGKKIVLALALSIGSFNPSWGQNHTLRSDQVIIDTQNHWDNWAFVSGTLDISATGEVTPAFVPKNNNAVLDIVEHFRRASLDPEATLLDAIEAGSNKAAVANLFDGDETTYWEPDPGSPLQDWWFQVDMGRLINATRVGLKFVPEGEGDPFLQFALLTGDDADPGSQVAGKVPMHLVYRTPADNKTRRAYELELDRGEVIGPVPGVDFDGDMVRFVQVVVTESDGARGVEVSAEEYEVLPAAERGDVVFHKKVEGGAVEIEEEVFGAIDASARGPIRFYRRERPRLAEMEVYELGRNISQGMIEDRSGSAESSHEGSIGNLVDGEGTALTFNLRAFQSGNVTFGERFLGFDLGASYWLDTVQLWYNLSAYRLASASLHIYHIQVSDGTPAPGGGLLWGAPEQVRGLGTAAEVNTFQPIHARYVRVAYPFASSESGREGNKGRIREVQLYGEGHHPQVELESGLIPLQGAKNLVSIEWDADIPPGTSVQIQTRTGNEVTDAYRYYDNGGVEVSAGKYEKLGFFKKGRIDTLQVAGSDWSNWSAPYDRSGDPIASPSPRQFLVLRARLTTEDPALAATLRSIRLNFNPPVAQQLQGELDTAIFERLGTPQQVSLYIKPTFSTRDLGFDEILVRTPPDMAMKFDALRMGSTSQWESGEVEEVANVEVVETRTDSLWLRLDQLVRRGGQTDLIEVRFITALFSPGAVLQAAMGNSTLVNSWQQVDPGDATERAPTQGLQILASSLDKKVLDDVAIRPPVVTPNGDGVNDQVRFDFTVRRLSGVQPVEIQIFDLSGRPVRKLDVEQPRVAGTYAIDWAADDEQGQLVPPGIYILRIKVDADSDSGVEQTAVQRLLHVAY
ncbi:MAG: hypothetical protein GKR89_11795 [Candidatus Latescibacteria bacterium]|nr:hypothetical protein [Candidatus Latescibacterota bacterium]